MRRSVVLLCLLLTGCATFTLMTKRRSWPAQTGDYSIWGASDAVIIRRDEWGVPHVRAQTTGDAIFGLGFAHAQDRLFQADLGRHMAFGRLSEWFGEDAVAFDTFARSLGIEERAAASFAALGPVEQEILESYAAGFNEAVRIQRILPVEYRLLHVELEPWTPIDCLAIIYLMSLDLAENPVIEVAALQLRDEVDAETLDALYRFHPDTPPVDAYWDTLRKVEIGALTPAFQAYFDIVGSAPDSAEASNSWIIGPSRSADGFPVVVNDPHLSQRVPSIWYTAELAGGELHVAGATLPGAPGVVIGHNKKVAWGLTNTMADYIDLAVLERVGTEGYRIGGTVQMLERVPVEIAVKGKDTVHTEVVRTSLGPVITDSESPYIVAFQWHALAFDDKSVSAFLGLNLAETVGEALVATRVPMVASQNLVVADTGKDWAWQVIGSIPQRKSHTGRVPYPAWTAEHGWSGWLTDLPGERRPERSFVVTANSRPDHPKADLISTSYVPAHRQDRITELLGVKSRFTLKETRIIQMDIVDQAAVDLIDGILGGVRPKSVPSRTCLTVLSEWDRHAQTTSVGATLWAIFQYELVSRALEDHLSPEALGLYLSTTSPSRSLLYGGFDHFATDKQRIVDAALHRTCTKVAERYGEDPVKWTWGDAHQLQLRHPFGSRLHGWNTPKVRYAGTGTTIAAAGYTWGSDLSVTSMSSMRTVMPLSNLSVSTMAHPGGQSGHPGHPDYMEEFTRFARGGTLPLWYADVDIGAESNRALILLPAIPKTTTP